MARNHGELVTAILHRLQMGDWRGCRIGDLLVTDEGLVELERLAGDESVTFEDRNASTVVVCDPKSVDRLMRLRMEANRQMDERAVRVD